MKIETKKIKDYDNNGGFSYTGLFSEETTFYKHKMGVVAVYVSRDSFKFWNNTKEVLVDFIYNKVEYTTGFDEIKNIKSLGLRIDKFVKECVRMDKEQLV